MDFDLNSIKKYYHFESRNAEVFQNISEETSEDLNLDFLFFKLDKTNSKIGRQYLYSKFRLINQEIDSKLIRYVDYFQQNESSSIETELNKLGNLKDYEIIDLIENDIIVDGKYLQYAKLSLIFLSLILVASFFVQQVLLFLIPLLIANAYYHYSNKSYVEYYNSIISRLFKTLVVAKNIGKREVFVKEYKTINLRNLRRTFWSSNLTQQLAKNEFLIIFWAILEIFRITFNLEIFGFNRKVKILNSSKKDLMNVFEFIGKIDTANTISKTKNEYETCNPNFTSGKKIMVKNIYHPLIDNCTKNSLELENNSIVLTGSNMSGKTSFMRCIAVNAIMAQSFGFCFAEKYQAPFMNILSSISIRDDINESKSYYLEEVLRIKDFMKSSDVYNLILIDEIFRGTNTNERIAISKAVLKGINSTKNFVFITTHDLEIAYFLEQYDYQLYYFSEEVTESNKLIFTYTLNKGINNKTNAIRILEMYDYPKEIIAESYKYLSNKSNQRDRQ